MNKEQMFDRIKGTIYGVACGDCLGAPAEFRDREEIRRRYGQITNIIDGSLIGAHIGCGTDDTAMTLAVAEGIMKSTAGDDLVEKIGAEFVRWYNGTPIGLGATCGSTIEIASDRGRIQSPTRDDWFRAAEITDYHLGGRSGGNGTLMRTAPIALLIPDEQRDQVARDVSKMTHYDEDAATACVLYCEIISKLIHGCPVDDAVSCLNRSEDYGVPVTNPKPTGYVKDSFKTALWGWTNKMSFEDILITVVNLGGDADTTGAIVGGLAGAEYGFSAIPQRWIKALSPNLKYRLNVVTHAAARLWGCEING